ncbi:MAG: LysR family transcriptional regulator [Betaproteobacteria bacterium]|nr:LysR family transcriptional regulator [Betaproteobacteria bacterium]
MRTPELWQLRYFTEVAERLHFGRAAEALHISQPPLSRAIRGLESLLGVTLLSRTKRRVALTAEGERLLDEARRLLRQAERIGPELAAMAAGEAGRLRIGFVSLADYGVLPPLLKAYKAAHPSVRLGLREMLSPQQASALASGELDFGFLLPPVARAEELEHVVVQRERFVAALPARHRLARTRGRLGMRSLAGEPLVMVPREIAPGLYDIVAGLAERAGAPLNVSQEAIQMQTVVSLVSSGLGCAIVPASVANLGRRGVAYRPIADPHPALDIWLAWRSGALGGPAREFLQLAGRA